MVDQNSLYLSSMFDLLEQLGSTATFRRVTEGAYDPGTGQTGASSTDDETVQVAFVNYRENEVDGELVQRGDRKALLSATRPDGSSLSKTPQTKDQFVGEGDTVHVISVTPFVINGSAVAYSCQVRE